jgi:hypothetical protein
VDQFLLGKIQTLILVWFTLVTVYIFFLCIPELTCNFSFISNCCSSTQMLLFVMAKTSHLNWFPVGAKSLCFPTSLSTRADIVMLTGQGLKIHTVNCKWCTYSYITGTDLE